ncbi:brain-specific angiogenesis inhibitor 1-associated protein 2 [Egretta garzetta]|uniref:brain-specific angiogenesis inhibitor 1-associated protein 2 n=1 Tax=Egretta garzetta TaxID=188379 RepID=UPI00163BC5A3|nr:brain-specific angiogenesis inhibitor 1-associated protein 2 [Egretta garzetta]
MAREGSSVAGSSSALTAGARPAGQSERVKSERVKSEPPCLDEALGWEVPLSLAQGLVCGTCCPFGVRHDVGAELGPVCVYGAGDGGRRDVPEPRPQELGVATLGVATLAAGGDVLFQMAEVHRQIQNQLEEMLKSFHNELLTQLEQKVELDSRYLSYIEAISNKQGELENYVSDGYKTALTEERRRFCFLVEKQWAVAKSATTHRLQGKEMLTQKLPLWQQSCSDPNKIPDRAIQLMQQMAASSNGTIMPSPLSTSKSNLIISDPIPGAKPLPVPPELAPFVGRMSAQEAMPVMNGASGPDSDGYNHWSEMKPAQPKSLSPPQPQKQLSDSYSNTLPVRKNVPPKNSYASAENKTLPRSSSMAAGLERNGRTRVQAIFSHAAGDNSTLLSFKEGDLITLLVPEARDGWHYGESEKTKMRGWFPFSYTRVLDNDGSERVHASLQQGKSSSTGNLLDKDDIAIPPPDYGMASQAFPAQGINTFKQRPYSVAVPAFSQGLDDYGTRSVSRNPFANVQLKPTVTNDRSAPLIS